MFSVVVLLFEVYQCRIFMFDVDVMEVDVSRVVVIIDFFLK